MVILSTMPTGMGGQWQLVKYSDDFYAYGTEKELNSFLGTSVDKCGTLDEVLNHCLNIAELCKKHIAKYEVEKQKSKNPNGWQILIEHEQKELAMVMEFAKILSHRTLKTAAMCEKSL